MLLIVALFDFYELLFESYFHFIF